MPRFVPDTQSGSKWLCRVSGSISMPFAGCPIPKIAASRCLASCVAFSARWAAVLCPFFYRVRALQGGRSKVEKCKTASKLNWKCTREATRPSTIDWPRARVTSLSSKRFRSLPRSIPAFKRGWGSAGDGSKVRQKSVISTGHVATFGEWIFITHLFRRRKVIKLAVRENFKPKANGVKGEEMIMSEW